MVSVWIPKSFSPLSGEGQLVGKVSWDRTIKPASQSSQVSMVVGGGGGPGVEPHWDKASSARAAIKLGERSWKTIL